MNQKFIEQIPVYLKEFKLSSDVLKKEQKWIEEKIMSSFQSSLKELMEEKLVQEQSHLLNQKQAITQSSCNDQSNKDENSQSHQQKYTISGHLIDLQIIKSQMRINQKEYPKLLPPSQMHYKVKPEQILKTYSQSYTHHNISTQSTNIPPTSINNRQSKNYENLSLQFGEDETVAAAAVSAFSVNTLSTNNQNTQNQQKRNIQHKKSHSNSSNMSRGCSLSSSYAEQQKKRKLFHKNNISNNTMNNSFHTNNNNINQSTKSIPLCSNHPNKKNIHQINISLPL